MLSTARLQIIVESLSVHGTTDMVTVWKTVLKKKIGLRFFYCYFK